MKTLPQPSVIAALPHTLGLPLNTRCFCVPAYNCKIVLSFGEIDAAFLAIDPSAQITDMLDGASLHGGIGTVDIFRHGMATCSTEALKAGFQIRSAGEFLELIRES